MDACSIFENTLLSNYQAFMQTWKIMSEPLKLILRDKNCENS